MEIIKATIEVEIKVCGDELQFCDVNCPHLWNQKRYCDLLGKQTELETRVIKATTENSTMRRRTKQCLLYFTGNGVTHNGIGSSITSHTVEIAKCTKCGCSLHEGIASIHSIGLCWGCHNEKMWNE